MLNSERPSVEISESQRVEDEHRLWVDDVTAWRKSARTLVRKMTELQQSLLSWDAELESLLEAIRRYEGLRQSRETALAEGEGASRAEIERLRKEAETSRRQCGKRRDRLEKEFRTLIDAHRSALESVARESKAR